MDDTLADGPNPALLPSDLLLQRTAQGDRTAFRALYDRHVRLLYAVALRITRHPNLAADTVQESFMQIWQNARLYTSARGTPEAWMVGMTRYRALDLIRRAGPAAAGLDAGEPLPETLDGMPDTDDSRALRQCLEQLQPDRRRLILLAYVEGYSQTELAGRLAAPLGTVKSTLRRTLAALRNCLQA